MERFLGTVAAFGERESIDFTVTVDADPEKVSDGLKKYF